MKKLKVLVIAFHFPPLVTAGTYRTVRFVKNFHQFDLDAVILTVKNPDPSICPSDLNSTQTNTFCGFPVYRVKELNVKPLWRYPVGLQNRISRLFPRLFKNKVPQWGIKFIDKQWGWIVPGYLKARKLVRQHNIDMIYVSSPPRSAAIIGLLLKKRFQLPLVFDFRDPWMSEGSVQSRNFFFRKHLYQKLHETILNAADAINVVTWSMQEQYNRLASSDKVNLIFNGYDATYQKNEVTHNDHKLFKIAYLGGWTTYNRSPENILCALKQCQFPWELISVGNENKLVNDLAKKYQLENHVRSIPSVPKEKLLCYFKEATVLFIIQGGKDNPAIASKTMDYLATGKHILGQMDDSDNAKFLKKYTNQCTIVGYDDVEGLKNAINNIYTQWQNNNIHIISNERFLLECSGESLTKKLRHVMINTYNKFYKND